MLKKLFAIFSVLICMNPLYAIEPDFIRTTVYNVDSSGNDLISTVYSGLGREVQSKFKIGNDKDRVVSTFYDEIGRKIIATKPFIDTIFGGMYLPGDFNSINDFLKETYKEFDTVNGDPFAYTEIEYYNDPSGRIKKTGSPGVRNRLGLNYVNRSWFYGVSLTSTDVAFPQGTVLFNNGFISSIATNTGYDTVDLFDTLYAYLLQIDSIFAPRTHFLTVVMEPLGSYSQKLDDKLGRTVASWSDPSSSVNDEIISNTRYDVYGNVLEEIAPVNLHMGANAILLSNTKYLYNTLGNVIRKETPDGAIDTFIYNNSGTIGAILSYSVGTNGSRALYERIDYLYDTFGRQTRTLIVRDGYLIHRVLNFYDNIELINNERDLKIPVGVLNKLENLCKNLVGSAVYNYVEGNTYVVVDLYSYNDEGEIGRKFKIVPGLPLQEISYDYDIHGKTVEESIICGNDTIIKGYIYDSYGRLSRVIHKNNNDKELVKFSYNDLGKTTIKTLDSLHDIEYYYTIQDQIRRIGSNGPRGFREDISYLENSSIDTVKSIYMGSLPDSLTNSYHYDNVNRLVTVKSSKTEYNSNYDYDQVGRFKSKEEGKSIINNYYYHPKTNRLKYSKDNNRDYVYDQRGNLIIDRFKNMMIQYNGQNMPIQFKFYKSIPSSIRTDERGTVVIPDTTFVGNIYKYMDHISDIIVNCRLISKVTMLYDASGKRVLKMESIQ